MHPKGTTNLWKIILTRAGYTCTACRCTTPVHLNYTYFTPPKGYPFLDWVREYHWLFDLLRQFSCLRLKTMTWWDNIFVLDHKLFFFVVILYNSGYHKHQEEGMLESVWQEHIRSPHGWSALHNHLPPASAIL